MNLIFDPTNTARPPIHIAFGKEFDRACANSMHTTAALARIAKVDSSTILSYRRGHSKPSDEIRGRLEKHFGRPFP